MALPFDLDALNGLEQATVAVGESVEAPRLCRIHLSKDAPHPITLSWNPGQASGTRLRKILKPGESTIETLLRAEVWFGPFTIPMRFAATTDERQKESLRNFWRTEKQRVLARYDYPRQGGNGNSPSMKITGPHRFPDVTVTVIEPDETEHEPIRLHQLYAIGEFDTVVYEEPEDPTKVREEYELRLAAKDQAHADQIAAMQAQLAELSGKLSGFMSGMAGKAKG